MTGWTLIFIVTLIPLSLIAGYCIGAIMASGKHSDDCANCALARLLQGRFSASVSGGCSNENETKTGQTR